MTPAFPAANNIAALQRTGNHTQTLAPVDNPATGSQIPLISVRNGESLRDIPPVHTRAGANTQLPANGPLLELDHLPRPTLDELSRALAARPLSGDAFLQLIRAGFERTVLARPMAEVLVDNALPQLLDPDDMGYAAWRDVLVHALILPPDRWETECLGLRPGLSHQTAHTSPLLTWLRDALYRPQNMSHDAWRAHLAHRRRTNDQADAQQIAKEQQITAPAPDKNQSDIRRHLQRLISTLPTEHLDGCMKAVRQHTNKDRGLLDVRMALPAAFEHLEKKQIDTVYMDLNGEHGQTHASLDVATAQASHARTPHEATDPTARLLLHVGRDAQLTPQNRPEPLGKYNTLSHALVSLLYWPGQLRGTLDGAANAAFIIEYLTTHGQACEVARAINGVWPMPGWMQEAVEVRLPRIDTDAANANKIADETVSAWRDFNNAPEGPGIRLETFEPVGDVYRRAGHLIEREAQTSAFLSRQALPDGATGQAEATFVPATTTIENNCFSIIFPMADAASRPQLGTGEIQSGLLLYPPGGTRPGALTREGLHLFPEGNTVSAPPPIPLNPLEPRGDIRILVDTLRQQQASLSDQATSQAHIDTNAIFVPVSMHSIAADYVTKMSPILTHLKLSMQSGGTPPDSRDLPDIQTTGLIDLLKLPSFSAVDWSQPSNVIISLSGQQNTLFEIRLRYKDARNKDHTVSIGDLRVRLLRDYGKHIASTYASVDQAGRSFLKNLAIRDDGKVSIRSMLQFYGVAVPQKSTTTDLTNALEALRPRAAMIASANDPRQPAVTRAFALDTTNLPSPLEWTFDGQQTSDYQFISRKIKDVCDKAYGLCINRLATTHAGASESLLLGGLKNLGGVAIKIRVNDTDGVDNTYVEQHIVNPKNETLEGYFEQSAKLLGDYMINKIRGKDGRNEGEINIAGLNISLQLPHFVTRDHNISNRDARIFDIRSDEPPFLYVDANAMSSTISASISKAIGGISDELRDSKGDILKSRKFLYAAYRMLDEDGISLSSLSETEQATKISEVLNKVLKDYYRISSANLEKLQRLLVAQQPDQVEVVCRAICQHLGMDEFNWPIVATHGISIDYRAGALNTGTLVPHDTHFSGTMLELVYNEQQRTEIGLASNKDAAVLSAANQLAGACLTKECKAPAINAKLHDFFRAYSMGIAGGVRTDSLPETIKQPEAAFRLMTDRYAQDAARIYRDLEAERMVLTSASVLERIARADSESNSSQAIDFSSMLNHAEKALLDERSRKFHDFLKLRRNPDNFNDLQPWWTQAAEQIKDVVRQVCRNAPAAICPPFLLIDGIVEGADAETITMDTLSFLSSRLGALRKVPMRRLGSLMENGANAWSLKKDIEAYYQALKEGKYKEANEALIGLLEGGQSMLSAGVAVAGKVRGAMTAGKLEHARSAADSKPANAITPISRQQTTPENQPMHYWSVGQDGKLSRGNIGATVMRSLPCGDLIVNGGARAIRLGDGATKVYMLGDTVHQATRMPSGRIELLPMSTFALREHGWVRSETHSHVTYSPPGQPAFPVTFSGLADGSGRSSRGPVTWFDNRQCTFERLDVQPENVDGQSDGTLTARIGVIEHKYVLDGSAALDILEHGGVQDGKTTFLRSDGSKIVVPGRIPASPQYKSEFEATVTGIESMFAAVKATGAVSGLKVKSTVSGVIGTTHSGSHELIAELDAGVYYRGDIPAGMVAGQKPFRVRMHKIPTDADPKRASLALWSKDGGYRDGPARDDFALELFYGARFANRAYSKNPGWVRQQHERIAAMRHALPHDVRTTTNPYYKLRVGEADAILFAPRNRVALANTLIAKDVTWGTLSAPDDLSRTESALRDIQISDRSTDSDASTSPLLGEGETISVTGDRRVVLHNRLKEKIGGRNLVVVDIETKDGRKSRLVNIQSRAEAGVSLANNHFDPFSSNAAIPDITVKDGARVRSISTEPVIRQLQTVHPHASTIKTIDIFSLDPIPKSLAEDIFTSSANGYHYNKIFSLIENSATDLPGMPEHRDTARTGDIRAVNIDLDGHTPIAQGARRGAYKVGDRYYVPLASGGFYRATWDFVNRGFRLVPEGSNDHPVETLPLVRRISGKFTPVNSAGIMTGNAAPSPIKMDRLKQALTKNPTPPVLRTIKRDGTDIVIVADPSRVVDKPKLDGSWVLSVDGVEYRPVLTEADQLAYVRDNPEEAMTVSCTRRARAIEPLCGAGAGAYIESTRAVTGTDLPAEGTDRPDTEVWTTWASDRRVYGSKLPDNGKLPPFAKEHHIVPYDGKYCKIDMSKGGKPMPLNKKQLKQVGLPDKVPYAAQVDAQLIRREGHGAQLRIENFDTNLPSSKMELGASVFRRKGTPTEWMVTHHDDAWYVGTFDRSIGESTPTTIAMRKLGEKELLSAQEKEIMRMHAGMQTANYHAKASSPEQLKDIMEVNRKLGTSSNEFDPSEYFVTSTTADQAFLFDRTTRENVQVKARADAKWDWLPLDQPTTRQDVINAKNDLLEISKTIFDDRTIQSIDDLIGIAGDKNIKMTAKNFLIVRENSGRIFFSISGDPRLLQTDHGADPALFKNGGIAEIMLNGKKETITYIDKDPQLPAYMEALDRSGDYPRALPTAATPDQVGASPMTFDVTGPRSWDTERKMIAYLTQGGTSEDRTKSDSVIVLNRYDACKSCATILQQYFKPFQRVVHLFGKAYPKYR